MDRNLRSWAVLVSALALHNVEEWTRDLPAWTITNASLPDFVAAYAHQGFGLGLVIVTLLPIIAAIIIRWITPKTEPAWLALVAWVLIVNAVWHVGVSIITWSFMPGIFTAIVLLLPASLYVLSTLPQHHQGGIIILWAVLVMIATIAATLALAALIANLAGGTVS